MKLMSIIGRAVDSLEYPLTSSQKRFIVAIREHWKDMVESVSRYHTFSNSPSGTDHRLYHLHSYGTYLCRDFFP